LFSNLNIHLKIIDFLTREKDHLEACQTNPLLFIKIPLGENLLGLGYEKSSKENMPFYMSNKQLVEICEAPGVHVLEFMLRRMRIDG